MSILIQTRVDPYSTPELYAELERIPAGNARTTRMKALANEALVLRRTLASLSNSQGLDLTHVLTQTVSYPATAGKSSDRQQVKDSKSTESLEKPNKISPQVAPKGEGSTNSDGGNAPDETVQEAPTARRVASRLSDRMLGGR